MLLVIYDLSVNYGIKKEKKKKKSKKKIEKRKDLII